MFNLYKYVNNYNIKTTLKHFKIWAFKGKKEKKFIISFSKDLML